MTTTVTMTRYPAMRKALWDMPAVARVGCVRRVDDVPMPVYGVNVGGMGAVHSARPTGRVLLMAGLSVLPVHRPGSGLQD